MGRWAEEEIVPSRGKYRNRRYSLDRFPAARLWFELLDSRRWVYHVATGPSQSGKTLNCFTIPILYCLFELNEDVIVGVPSLKPMANDKWKKDIKPILAKTRYANLMPRTGPGSRDGELSGPITFLNGASLTFMSFASDDKGKAGETARNIIITETDGGDEAQETSDEARPIEQLLARAASFDLDAFVIMECTVSTESGETWQRYTKGSAGRLIRPCSHCGEWVTPERKHFRGWEEAENEIDAGEEAGFHCPNCGEKWTDEERFAANEQTKIIHRGQELSKTGEITGPLPKTRTLGFRWSAVDNPFRTSKFLASLEWTAARASDIEDSQKALDQFQYAIPWKDPEEDETAFDPFAAMKRILETPRGIIPDDHEVITCGCDLRATQLHYVLTSWRSDATSRIVQYGTLKVHSRKLGVERAIRVALEYLRDRIIRIGFKSQSGEHRDVDSVWIDAGYKPRTVYNFVNETAQLLDNEVFMPYLGRGQSRRDDKPYTPKSKVSRDISYLGEEFYFAWNRDVDPHVEVAFVNADHWKSFLHNRLSSPILDEDGEPLSGAMSLFIPDHGDHSEIMRHFGSEHPVKIFVPGVGEKTIWRCISRVNHYFDAAYACSAAASFNGVQVEAPNIVVPTADEAHDEFLGVLRMPDGREFFQ